MNAKHIIGFDLDGVILDHTKTKQALAKRYGFSLSAQDASSDRMERVLPEGIRLAIRKIIYNDPECALQATLLDGAERVLSMIKNFGIPFWLISRRRPGQDQDLAVQALQKHHLWPTFFDERNSFFVITPEDKNKIAAELGVTAYLDDDPKVLAALTSVPQRFLFDPLDAYPEETRFSKVRSWDELLTHIV